MSAADKEKLNGVAAGANAYSHPGYTARSSGLYKITVDSTGHISDVTAVTKADITALRLAIYEIQYDEDVPAGVAVNEAVELAKLYGTDKSPAFVNGVLGSVVRDGAEE